MGASLEGGPGWWLTRVPADVCVWHQVAKDASDIVILDDRFSSIVRAVIWGRCVYGMCVGGCVWYCGLVAMGGASQWWWW